MGMVVWPVSEEPTSLAAVEVETVLKYCKTSEEEWEGLTAETKLMLSRKFLMSEARNVGIGRWL